MTELETQVAKIHIGHGKQASTFISLFAEKGPHPSSELYVIVELPLFNPAALPDCQRIAASIPASLRRNYRRPITENTFEEALADINEELGKLASLGQTNWIGKLHAVVAVKHERSIAIATTGKISALLYRDDAFTDIADSTKQRHPLRTFENFAVGRLKESDVVVLATAELFNHISIDRLKNILKHNELGLASQQIVRILEENAGPEVACGSLLLHQLSPEVAINEQLQVSYGTQAKASYQHQQARSGEGAWSMLNKTTSLIRTYANPEPVISLARKLPALFKGRPGFSVTRLKHQGKESLRILGQTRQTAFAKFNLETFRRFSPQKKFFFISALVLLLAVVVNIFIAHRYKTHQVIDTELTKAVAAAQQQLTDAESSLVYNDQTGARSMLRSTEDQLRPFSNLPADQRELLTPINAKLEELWSKLEKSRTVEANQLATLSAASHLISAPGILATEAGGTTSSYNLATGATEEGGLKGGTTTLASSYIKGTEMVIFDGQGLEVWDYTKGTLSTPFYQNVPKASDFIGLAYYPATSRIYAINKTERAIMNYQVAGATIGKPVVWMRDNGSLERATDIAVDGSVYILNELGIAKYSQGKLAEFASPELRTPFGGAGALYADKDTNGIYLLDSKNKRIIVTNKKGDLEATYYNDKLQDAEDLVVNEKGKTVYFLNEGVLYKIGL